MRVCPQCSASYGDELQFCPADGGPLDAASADPFIGRVLLGQ